LSGKFDDPEYWLKLAAETRRASELAHAGDSKHALLGIAQRYELLADRAQRRLEERASERSPAKC